MNRSLLRVLEEQGIHKIPMYQGGADFVNATFPVSGLELEGAILFADLPGYTETSVDLSPMEAACLANWFTAWIESEAGRSDYFGGLIDKFIGDAVMLVFPRTEVQLRPVEAAMRTAKAIRRRNFLEFNPNIGIATGTIAIAFVGTNRMANVSAMGHTVNLASRCVPKKKPGVQMAIDDLAAVRSVFSEDMWIVKPVILEDLKGLPPVRAVHVANDPRPPMLSREEIIRYVKQYVAQQREQGNVRTI